MKFFFDTVRLTKNADSDHYSYSGYCTGFEARGSFSLSEGSGFGKSIIIFACRYKFISAN